MFISVVAFILALIAMLSPVEARRVALVVGQNAYPGGASATIGLPRLDNPVLDARRMAELLAKYSFEVIACDGKTPGCFDLDRRRFLDALKMLEERAAGADLAFVFFAGHGLATEEGNVLTPVDARVNCATGAVTQGVQVERIMAATGPARLKLVILDACRDNPLDEVCPNLKGKKLSFTRIEAGAMRGLLLVTSTQFGQVALDGPPGVHSPFATALFSTLEASPGIYFEQVFNEVARATYESAQKQYGFLQIPGKVVGGEAPADCLIGRHCVGDTRMAALEIENRELAFDASAVRNVLATEEQTRGKSFTAEERQKRVAELSAMLAQLVSGSASIITSKANSITSKERSTTPTKELSDKSVLTLMRYAWGMVPEKFLTPLGKTIIVDKSKPGDSLVPVETAREVIRVARFSAYAQLCKLAEEQRSNYQTLMRREEAKGKWTDQQMLFINQLHLFTVMTLTGKVQVVEKNGTKQVVVQNAEPFRSEVCTNTEKNMVRERIMAFVNADRVNASPPQPAILKK